MFGRLRRLTGLLLTVCCLSAGFATPCRAAADGVRVDRALLIGVDDFVSRQSTYPSSTNNVSAMQEALQASKTPFETIMIPASPVCGVVELADLIQDTFGGADEDDVSFLYISTHGEYDPENGVAPALLLSDGTTEECLSPQALQDAFTGIAGTKVLLLDACYSGAFIGKGMPEQPETLCFLGDDFKVLASSGAMEESWYWSAAQDEETAGTEENRQGAFYFTQMMSQCLNPRYGSTADTNLDGNITLAELYNALLQNHAASTPQVYPQRDDFVVFSYDLTERTEMDLAERSPIGDVTFSSSTLSRADNRLTLEFIVLRPVRVAYQVVYRENGKWRFDRAQLVYDSVEQYTAYGDEAGAVSPGRKVRTLSLDLQNGEASGYVIVQLVSVEDGRLTVHAGRVIAVLPDKGDLALAVSAPDTFTAGGPGELAIFVSHAYPCELSVSVVNEQGETVARLSNRQSTRPLKTEPEGSVFYWNGLGRAGRPAATGVYRINVTGYIGEETYTASSEPITVSGPNP